MGDMPCAFVIHRIAHLIGVFFHNIEIKAKILYNNNARPVHQFDCRNSSGRVIRTGIYRPTTYL